MLLHPNSSRHFIIQKKKRGRKLSYTIRAPTDPHTWEVRSRAFRPGIKNRLQNHFSFKTKKTPSWDITSTLVSAVFLIKLKTFFPCGNHIHFIIGFSEKIKFLLHKLILESTLFEFIFSSTLSPQYLSSGKKWTLIWGPPGAWRSG